MNIAVQIPFNKVQEFFVTAKFPADEPITFLVNDDTDIGKALKREQTLSLMQSLRGSIQTDMLSELLLERQADRLKEHADE